MRTKQDVIDEIAYQLGEFSVEDIKEGRGVTFTDENGDEKEAYTDGFVGDPETSELEEYLYEKAETPRIEHYY